MTSAQKTNDTASGQGIIAILSSLQFGIVLLIAIAVVATIGTVIPQNQPIAFYEEHFGGFVRFLVTVFRFDITYRSPLFIALMLLFGLNLVLCSLIRFPGLLKRTFNPDHTPSKETLAGMPVYHTAVGHSREAVSRAFAGAGFPLNAAGDRHLYGEKGRAGYLGSSMVHLSLLVFLVGGIVSLATSIRGYIMLEPGQTAAEAILANNTTIPLGFSITLDRFDVEFYEEFPGRPKEYTSVVTVEEEGLTPLYTDIRVNHPLLRHGFTVYQSSYGPLEQTPASDPDDRAVIDISLAGASDQMPPITTVTMKTGETHPVPGFGDSLTIRLAEVFRDYSGIQSAPGETNPAVRVDVLVHGEERWSVFAFQHFPGMNMPMSPDMPLLFTMTGIETVDTSESVPQPAGYYTVLGVTRDHGIPFMWVASTLMVVGLICSFYIRPRRIWLLEQDGAIHLGATTKGDTTSLEMFISGTMKTLRTK